MTHTIYRGSADPVADGEFYAQSHVGLVPNPYCRQSAPLTGNSPVPAVAGPETGDGAVEAHTESEGA